MPFAEGKDRMPSTKNAQDLWSIILAGGNGERLKPMVQRWLARHRPKQYCTFIGTRSMFQHTLDRSDRIVPAERRVAIIARDHRDDASPQLTSGPLVNGRWHILLSIGAFEQITDFFIGYLSEVLVPEADC
jgi:Nucleotidyl transferase